MSRKIGQGGAPTKLETPDAGRVGVKVTRSDLVGKIRAAEHRLASHNYHDQFRSDQELLLRCLKEQLNSFSG